jgi:hypothetical protein
VIKSGGKFFSDKAQLLAVPAPPKSWGKGNGNAPHLEQNPPLLIAPGIALDFLCAHP